MSNMIHSNRSSSTAIDHGWSFAVQEHHAPQGPPGRQAGRVFTRLMREIQVAARAACRTRRQPAPALGPAGGARRQRAQGQHRARDQARLGRRGRELRGGALRGLWPGRRRRDRRGADRQPQPHREPRCAPRSPSSAARSARPTASASSSTGSARSAIRAEAPTPTPCSRPRSRPAPRTADRARTATRSSARPDDLAAVREALEARLGPPEEARLGWRPQVYGAGRRRPGRDPVQAARDRWTTTTTCSA